MRRAGTFLAISLLVAGATANEDPWSRAESAIERLPAEKFVSVPPRVRDFIEAEGCVVPQPSREIMFGSPPANVVRGEFAKQGQSDWAVLCSKSGVSSIYVLWGGPARCPTPIESHQDRNFLQESGANRIVFSRQLTVIGPAAIQYTYDQYGATPPDVNHEAIEDSFLEKASSRHYCEAGVWRRLIGAD